MKKFKKPLIIIATIILLISSGILYIRYRQHQEHQKMVRIANSKEARKVYEEFINHIDPKALTSEGIIQSYDIDDETLDYNPMGGIIVRLFINNDSDLEIQYNLVYTKDKGYESMYYWTSKKLNEKLKGVNKNE